MNKAAFTEDELRQAALQVHEAMMAVLTPVTEHEFSFEFHRKMSNLLRKMELHHGIKAAARSVAAIFLALLIGGGALLTFNTDVRAAFFEWVREVYENSAFYQFVGEKEPEVLPYIRPTWMPEGYVEIDAVGNETRQTVIYQNSNDKNGIILFNYNRIHENKQLGLTTESGLVHKDVSVNGYEADIYIPNDDTKAKEILWLDDDLSIVYSISSYADEEIILCIAESVCLVE